VEEIRKRAREDKSQRAPLVALFLVCGDRLLATHRPNRPTMCLLSSFSPIFCRVAVQPSSLFDTPISRWIKIPHLRFFLKYPLFQPHLWWTQRPFFKRGVFTYLNKGILFHINYLGVPHNSNLFFAMSQFDWPIAKSKLKLQRLPKLEDSMERCSVSPFGPPI
jgi:hypothetical protein